MKEYIEKAVALEALSKSGVTCNMRAHKIVASIQAADVALVRHGRWVNENKNPVPWDECNSKCPSHSAYCSECREWLTASDEYPVTGLYCPNCGARMDKEDEHETD